MESVPCYTDFLRYINWHNLAFEVIREAGLPRMIIHYEQYGTNWNKTVTGKTYRRYYTSDEVDVIQATLG
eukprot:9530527-Ditylum_brightwellii.AAC.1